MFRAEVQSRSRPDVSADALQTGTGERGDVPPRSPRQEPLCAILLPEWGVCASSRGTAFVGRFGRFPRDERKSRIKAVYRLAHGIHQELLADQPPYNFEDEDERLACEKIRKEKEE